MRIRDALKRSIRDRARNCCEYCHSQEDFSPSTFSIEHIVPQSNGGTNEETNLALSCQECNNRKFTATKAYDPLSGEMVPLFHPRGMSWSDHFAWNADYTLILGLTPTGRATIEKLALNRGNVVNLRRVLRLAGVHPLTEIG
jgi:hypothetical protein